MNPQHIDQTVTVCRKCGEKFNPGSFNTWTALVCPQCRPAFRAVNQRYDRISARIARLSRDLEAAKAKERLLVQEWSSFRRVQ